MQGIPRAYQINQSMRIVTHCLQNLFTTVNHSDTAPPFSAVSVNAAILHELILGAVVLTNFDITHFEQLDLRRARRQWVSDPASSAFEATLRLSSHYNEPIRCYGELRENGGDEGNYGDGIYPVPIWRAEVWTNTGMPEELIYNIPLKKIVVTDRRCNICLDLLLVGARMPQLSCGHMFHTECIFSKFCVCLSKVW